jgi:molecular chaperone GrpE (heat shock protein)
MTGRDRTDALLRHAALVDAFADKDAEHAAELAGYRDRQDVLLRGLLEALDSLDRLAGGGGGEDSLRLVGRRLVAAIEAAGCAVIGAVGERAEPATHEVVEVRAAVGEPDDTVAEVLSRGYRSPDRVVPAKVIVVASGQSRSGQGVSEQGVSEQATVTAEESE